MSTIRIQDVVRPPPEWYRWIDSPERAAAMSRQHGADAADGDTSISAPDGFSRTLSIRDVDAAPTQQGATAAVIDLSNPYAAMNQRQKAGGFLPGDPGREAATKAADGAGAVLDLRHPAIAAQRLRAGVSR